jgi:hypothetical protein
MMIITVILFPVEVFYLVDWNLVLCLVGTDDNLDIKKKLFLGFSTYTVRYARIYTISDHTALL